MQKMHGKTEEKMKGGKNSRKNMHLFLFLRCPK